MQISHILNFKAAFNYNFFLYLWCWEHCSKQATLVKSPDHLVKLIQARYICLGNSLAPNGIRILGYNQAEVPRYYILQYSYFHIPPLGRH